MSSNSSIIIPILNFLSSLKRTHPYFYKYSPCKRLTTTSTYLILLIPS